ncbi:MAG: DoxX family protein [Rhodocyclaceae bacterium]
MSRDLSLQSARADDHLALVLLRVLTGAFYLPHVLSKIVGFAGTVVFFGKAGFHPPEFFVIFSGSLELLVGLALIFGVLTKYAAIVSAGLMVVAAYATIVVKGPGWYWNVGGIEYLIFWGLASLIVFVSEWKRAPGLLGFFKSW